MKHLRWNPSLRDARARQTTRVLFLAGCFAICLSSHAWSAGLVVRLGISAKQTVGWQGGLPVLFFFDEGNRYEVMCNETFTRGFGMQGGLHAFFFILKESVMR